MSVSVTMHDAKTNLSRYAALVEEGSEDKVVLKRGAKPVAQITAYSEVPHPFRIGLAKGLFEIGDIDAHNDEIAEMFYGGGE